jgi:tripartite-type tricarboxylate transporter receptor subunit TctC
VVPGATPREIVRRLNADVIKVLQLPEMAKRMAEFGLTPIGNSPEEFEAIIRSEIDRWGKVVKAAGIKPE